MDHCSFAGNSDAYGLGIRLGLYLQWVTTLTAAWLVPGELNNFLDVNTSFTFAVFFVLVYLTGTESHTPQSDSLYAVEAFILMWLCSAGFYCGVLSVPLDEEDSSKGLKFRLLILGVGAVALDIYSIWYFAGGMHHMARLPCGDKVLAFYCAVVHLYGRFRIVAVVFRALSVGAVPVFLGILLLFNRPLWLRLFIFFVFVLPAIIIIEVTINVNHTQGVQKVNTTGQLIPLFIGILSFLQLLSKADMKKIRDLMAAGRRNKYRHHPS